MTNQRLRQVILVLLVGHWLLAASGNAAERLTPLGVVRARVEQAVRELAEARVFPDRDRAVRRLIDLRRTLEADPRVRSSLVVRGLIRRVDRGLVLASRDLAVAASDSAEPRRQDHAGGLRAEAAALIELIQATVRPDTWDVNGGSGSIVYFATGHGLVVVAPDDVHDDVGDLLRQLR